MGIFGKKNKVSPTAEKAEPVAVPQNQTVAAAAKRGAGEKSILSFKVLLRPLISEKSTIGASLNKYVFAVAGRANKVEIKKAVADIYGVKPLSVNIINERRRAVRFGRFRGQTKKVKKAIVTLKKGDTIKLYEGI